MKNGRVLKSSFYIRDVNTVAKELLGKIFVRVFDYRVFKGMIVEVEAYEGETDEASHSYRGKTKRNEVMFKEGGILYVYFTYGMHYCANVVTGRENRGNAVLLRGIEPISEIEFMCSNRFGKRNCTDIEKINLTNGPAKICKAFQIGKEENGTDLTGDKIFILNGTEIEPSQIIAAERIGIKKSVDLPWRYYIRDNPFVSKK